MQTGRGRSPERLASSKEEWPPNSNSKSATTMLRWGSTLSMAPQPFDDSVVETANIAIAEAYAQQFMERQRWPLRIGNDALRFENLISAQRHVGFHAYPFSHCQFCSFSRRPMPFN